ncbi:MAG: hypothetical protein DRG78_07440 [Epsilonproteobacteria bacterium]|nr:MAG: hypothetical protein DRG78_07440 [Campylobacterota bacterium]
MIYTNNINSVVYDQYLEPNILGNAINDKIHYIQKPENLVVINVPDTYKYRPERVAKQFYGHESFYPLILAANNIGTLFEFVPSNFNNQIKMLKSEIIEQILNI